ncbi:2-phospho-L-lactate guanylyltransferase [Nocardioides koreensis]|uniref:2-phospho-L-lactate guanylyltransferase n=1 Tax=Nocardioides koreensis TaxID=433651 RepID=A0ABP5LI00_9ACTN
MTPQQYAALVPVKPPAHGKSRLVGPSDDRRRDLAAAFALDTVAACLTADHVVAVLAITDDATFARRLADLGCASIPDAVTGDLNATLRQAAAEALRRWPDLVPVAVCADLPALRARDLDTALDRTAAEVPSFVADAAGVGTTLYTAPHPLFDPRFGPGSRLAHLDAGAEEISGALPSLRRDVDDLTDLQEALALGVGPHTTAAEMQ